MYNGGQRTAATYRVALSLPYGAFIPKGTPDLEAWHSFALEKERILPKCSNYTFYECVYLASPVYPSETLELPTIILRPSNSDDGKTLPILYRISHDSGNNPEGDGYTFLDLDSGGMVLIEKTIWPGDPDEEISRTGINPPPTP